MNTHSMDRPRPVAKPADDSEPRDTGTFKATLPELGGFLTSDGQPIDPAPQAQPRPKATLPFYNDGEDPTPRLWLTVITTFLVAGVIGVALVSLLFVLVDDVVGAADDLFSVLRTSVR